MAFESALVVFAHPDDAEFMCGGTVARWAKEGTAVHYCVVTDGSAGSNEPGLTREQIAAPRRGEQEAAAEVLGVQSISWLGFVDGELEVNLETRRAVTGVVRTIRPEVLLAPDPSQLWFSNSYINHSDHVAAGRLALCAVMPDAPTRPQFPELLDRGLEPYEIPTLWLSSEDGDTCVDVTDTIDLKIGAIAKHVSQHLDDAEKWIRKRAGEYGQRIGVEYAEAFRTFDLADED
jgi:LmbE family N-acetylglucosaminyl deacetylase